MQSSLESDGHNVNKTNIYQHKISTEKDRRMQMPNPFFVVMKYDISVGHSLLAS